MPEIPDENLPEIDWTPNRLSKLRSDLASAVVHAGGMLLNDVPFVIEAKGDHDYVTDIDKAVQAVVYEELLGEYPRAGLIAEEQDNEGFDKLMENGCFIIDPIDGTHNFMNGSPICCVSVAYAEHGEILAGAVFAPMLGELYTAAKGLGAKLNGEKLHGPELPLSQGVVYVEDPWHADKSLVMEKALCTRILGSCTLAMC